MPPSSSSAITEKIFEQLDSFTEIPITVQTLCELMVAPKKHYRGTDKFMRGLEKNMLVGKFTCIYIYGENGTNGTRGSEGADGTKWHKGDK